MDCRVEAREMMENIWMLTDRMGMHMTLAVGKERALLVDTGYGLDDLNAAIRRITPLPLTVLLTHGHHDHACGAYQFPQVLLHEKEEPVFSFYAGQWRKRVWDQATQKGLDLSDWTETAFVHMPCGKALPVTEEKMDLGGLTARILHCPGHTEGSLCVYIEEKKLLLPGDNMNPTTWIFFPECKGLGTLIASLQGLSTLPFEQVLCPHFHELLPRKAFDSFLLGLTRENVLATSTPVFHLWEGKHVYACRPSADIILCYDGDKLPEDWK